LNIFIVEDRSATAFFEDLFRKTNLLATFVFMTLHSLALLYLSCEYRSIHNITRWPRSSDTWIHDAKPWTKT